MRNRPGTRGREALFELGSFLKSAGLLPPPLPSPFSDLFGQFLPMQEEERRPLDFGPFSFPEKEPLGFSLLSPMCERERERQ